MVARSTDRGERAQAISIGLGPIKVTGALKIPTLEPRQSGAIPIAHSSTPLLLLECSACEALERPNACRTARCRTCRRNAEAPSHEYPKCVWRRRPMLPILQRSLALRGSSLVNRSYLPRFTFFIDSYRRAVNIRRYYLRRDLPLRLDARGDFVMFPASRQERASWLF